MSKKNAPAIVSTQIRMKRGVPEVVSVIRPLHLEPKASSSCMRPVHEEYEPIDVAGCDGVELGAPILITEAEAAEIARGRIPRRITAIAEGRAA